MHSRATSLLRRSIQRHYDSLALPYRTFWGEHIHHGLWESDDDPPLAAQERLVSRLADKAQLQPDERVLDVGCGYGAPARWLTARLGCQVTGITVSKAQARLLQKHNRRTFRENPTPVVRADAAVMPFVDGAFDAVWVIECIEHLFDKQRFIAKAASMLRRGGRFALCTWQRGGGVPANDPQVRDVCEAFLCPALASAEEYRVWCEAAGLDLVCAEDLTGRVRKTWDILMGRVGRPWLGLPKLLLGSDTRRFLRGFPHIFKSASIW